VHRKCEPCAALFGEKWTRVLEPRRARLETKVLSTMELDEEHPLSPLLKNLENEFLRH
jgi:hypothetical protein